MNPEVNKNQSGENVETGWEDLENLEHEADFSPDENVEDFQIPTMEEKEAAVADAREAVEAAYQNAFEVSEGSPAAESVSTAEDISATIEQNEAAPEPGIKIKRRNKLDFIGRARDKKRLESMIDIIEDGDPDKPVEEKVAEASQYLDEHTSALLLDKLFDEGELWENEQAEVWTGLFDKIDEEDIKSEARKSDVSIVFATSRIGSRLSEKSQTILSDIITEQTLAYRDDNEEMPRPLTLASHNVDLRDIQDFSSENRAKILGAMVERGCIGNAMQLLDDDLVDKYREQISEKIKSDKNITLSHIAMAYASGLSAEELGLTENAQKVMDTLIENGNTKQDVSLALESMPDMETIDELGVDLTLHIQNQRINSYIGWSGILYGGVEDAKNIRQVYEALGEDGNKLDLKKIDYLRDKPELVAALVSQNNISDRQLRIIDIAHDLNIELKSLDDMENVSGIIRQKANELLQMAEKTLDVNERLTNVDQAKDMVSYALYGVNRDELKVLARRTGLITDNRDRYNQVFDNVKYEEFDDDHVIFKKKVIFSLDKYENMVKEGKIGADTKGEIMAMLAFLNAGDSPKKLRTNLALAEQNPNAPAAFYDELEKLDRIMMAESNKKFAAEMTSPDKLIADGAEVSTVDYQAEDGTTKQIQVINLDGRPFKILTHCLGAFGNFDLTKPEAWNERTGRNYISSSLIANNCIRTAGDRTQGVYYGFANLGEQTIAGMSSGDLAVYDVKLGEDKTPDDESDDRNTNIMAHRQTFWYENPDELIDETNLRETNGENGDWYHTYNEVVLNRYKGGPDGDPNDRLQPSCILCFGKDESAISEDMKRHAAYFGVPIYLIDEERYNNK